jgi:hypothetical protein
MKYVKHSLLICFLFATVVFNPSNLPSCGPIFPDAIFVEKRTPPLPDYIQGRLGVLQPTFDRKYLFMAYRYLSGQPLTEEEKHSLTKAASSAEPESIWTGAFSASPAMKEWLDARGRIPGIEPSPEIQSSRNEAGKSNEWRWFKNCSEDAFKTAARTLDERSKSYGINHPEIKNWARSQDMVFSNCSKGEAIPAAADPQLPKAFQYDRAYQIAAAHFYAEHYDTAASLFDTIAADKGSPWSELAPYLAARCWIRKATVPQKYGEFDRNALMEADKKLKGILNDKNRAVLHVIAAKLESFVNLRLNPLDHFYFLSEKLGRQSHGDRFEQDLIDYQYLMRRIRTFPGLSYEDVSRSSEMTDWIYKFESGDSAYCLKQWKAKKSAAWLLAAIVNLHANDPDAAALMDAAQTIPKNSPAFATAQYHRIRLMLESGKKAEARSLLDELLPNFRSELRGSSLNLFLAQRLGLARNFEEFLEFAPRIPQRIDGDYYPSPELKQYTGNATPLFDADSIQTLNRALPLKYLSRAATSRLPLHMRKQIICATWVRAVLLSDNAVAVKLAGELENVHPDLKPDLKLWREAGSPESKKIAAALLMLHFPGMSPYLKSGVPRRGKLEGIDNFRENWWCGFNAGNLDEPTGNRYSLSKYQQEQKNMPEPADSPSFLNDTDKADFKIEWKKLASVPTAPDYFGRVLIPWARNNPKDNRVPEVLHLIVKATRFGCTDEGSGKYSREAFQLLHSKYTDTSWAKLTPYWYR